MDTIVPVTEEDFEQFDKALTEKISLYSASKFYPDFLESLISKLCLDLNAASLKKIKMNVEAMHSAKMKQEKAEASKAKKGKGKGGSLRMDTDKVRYFVLP